MSKEGNNPVIPPRPELPYSTGTASSTGQPPPPPQRTYSAGKAPTSRKEQPPMPPAPPPAGDPADWGDDVRARELEEARLRVTQMEKTMRWWSDCTASWREKWTKVRNDRNKLREECRQLRSKLETSVKIGGTLKRDKQQLLQQMDSLRKELKASLGSGGGDAVATQPSEGGPQGGAVTATAAATVNSTAAPSKDNQTLKDPEASVCSSGSHKSLCSDPETQPAAGSRTETPSGGQQDRRPDRSPGSTVSGAISQDDFVSRLLSRKEKDRDSSSSSHSDRSELRKASRTPVEAAASELSVPTEDLIQKQLSELQVKLAEAQDAIQAERQDKASLITKVEESQTELTSLRSQLAESKRVETSAAEKLSQLTIEHDSQLSLVNSEIQEESESKDSLDRRLADLRKQLERLQAENAQEWAKRERLESEKLNLERENKNLKQELEALREELEQKAQQAAAVVDGDLRDAQRHLADKAKEVSDLRHAHSKVKKALQEKSAELEHANSRAQQYEGDVKKLRGRIDDLKKQLGRAEDEADHQAHQVRKLQRNNDELQQQVDNLSVQVQHLQSRLLRGAPSLGGARSTSLPAYDNHESTTDAMTDEDGDDAPP